MTEEKRLREIEVHEEPRHTIELGHFSGVLIDDMWEIYEKGKGRITAGSAGWALDDLRDVVTLLARRHMERNHDRRRSQEAHERMG